MIALTESRKLELIEECKKVMDESSPDGDIYPIYAIALASLTAESIAHADSKAILKMIKGHTRFFTSFPERSETKRVGLFMAPPVSKIIDIESDVKNIIQLLSGREWAEHCTSTELGKELESQITNLYNEVSKIKLPDRDKLPGWARNHEDSLDWYESEIKRLNGLGE